jgi:hypothetical protein
VLAFTPDVSYEGAGASTSRWRTWAPVAAVVAGVIALAVIVGATAGSGGTKRQAPAPSTTVLTVPVTTVAPPTTIAPADRGDRGRGKGRGRGHED